MINNAIVHTVDAPWSVNIRDKSTNKVVANNILLHRGSRGSITISADSLSGSRSDNSIVVDWFSADDGSHFVTLADWSKATGTDSLSPLLAPGPIRRDGEDRLPSLAWDNGCRRRRSCACAARRSRREDPPLEKSP